MSDRHMFFFLIYRIGDWSLNNRFISRDFFNNLIRVDRLSRKQRFEKKACLDNITVVLQSISDGHISILGNRKVCYRYNITNFP